MASGYADGGDAPDKPIELVPGAAEDARAFLATHPQTRERCDRVADVVRGFETPSGLELLSTDHWVVARDGAQMPGAVVEATYRWNDRKRQFSPRQIALVHDVLTAKGWLRQ